jgi:hypothetical protein
MDRDRRQVLFLPDSGDDEVFFPSRGCAGTRVDFQLRIMNPESGRAIQVALLVAAVACTA